MARVVQHRVEIVDAAAAFALHGKVRIDRLRTAEQHQHLVQQVRPQVVPQAAARPILLAPALAHLRAVAVEMGVALGDVTERAVGKQCLQGQEVRIEAPVLEHGGDASGAARCSQYLLGFVHVHRERFVHQHMLAGGQRGDGQRRVLFVRGGDDHRIHRGVIEDLLRGSAYVDVTEGAQQRIALRTDDAVQGQPRRVLDQRGVEDAAGQAVADQGQLQLGAHGKTPRGSESAGQEPQGKRDDCAPGS
ncbi:hypothetical protein D3C73_991910 [compost metagenome]